MKAAPQVWPADCICSHRLCILLHPLGINISSQGTRSRTIRELLDDDHVCREIVQYLMRHNEAADTASGIAEWWIKRDIPRTSEALTKLRAHDVVRSHVVQEATSVYTLTKSRFIRETLRHYVGQSPPTRVEPLIHDYPRADGADGALHTGNR
jgi:hypothetical protein